MNEMFFLTITDVILAIIVVVLLLIWGELRALRANLFTYAKKALPGDWSSHLRIP